MSETSDQTPCLTARPDDPFAGHSDRVVLMGLGNTLLSDEGVGVHVINKIKEQYAFSPPIDIIDGGTLGLDLLPLFQERDRLLIIDAVDFGKDSGFVGTLERDAIPSVLNPKLSAHHIGVSDLLFTTRLTRATMPEVSLIGIQPGSLELGLDMTPEIRDKLKSIIGLAVQKLTAWGVCCSPR